MTSYDLLAIVINYNSKPFIGIVKKLMEGIAELNNYISTKLLFVDNASNDGSFEEVVAHARKAGTDVKEIKLTKNFGFTRAVNLAWHYAHKRWNFKYLALLNNDLIIVPQNLAKLTAYLEIEKVAGVQGTIMQMYDPHLIDNCGFMIDQLGLTYPVCRGYPFNYAQICMPSYLSGACALYRADVIAELGQPFNNSVESYYDDKYLGLRMWNKGYLLLHVPLITAYHLGSASYSGLKKVIKGTKWFEGVVFAEVAATFGTKTKAPLVLLFYGTASVIMSLMTLDNYVQNYISVAKRLTKYRLERIDIKNVPHIFVILDLDRLFKGYVLRK